MLPYLRFCLKQHLHHNPEIKQPSLLSPQSFLNIFMPKAWGIFCSLFFSLCITICCMISSSANAQTLQLSHSEATLSASVSTAAPGQPFWLMLHLHMQPGWHGYWKNPGDSGLAPEFQWQTGPELHIKAVQYLPPQEIKFGDLVNLGYENDAYYLFPAEIKSSDKQQFINLKATWLVCHDACIPQSGEFNLAIDTGKENIPSQLHNKITSLVKQLPEDSTTAISYLTTKDDLTLKIPAKDLAITTTSRLHFFPEESSVIKLDTAQSGKLSQGHYLLNVQRDFAELPKTLSGVLAISDIQHTQPTHYLNIHAQAEPEKTASDGSIWQALLFAFLGGIILNAMPCVFPILALKALSISQASQSRYQHHLWHGICYSLGVILSFFLLALVLVIMKSFGQDIGWGYQMQSPITVALLIYLFLLIALNFSGYFEFGTSFMGTGQGLTEKKGASGSFFTGVLATIVATPCTAPFMGTAIGYALLQPPAASLSILTVLGIGMALPLLAISAIPQLGRLLPKPGSWMQTFQQCLAFPMFLAAAWLLWVFMQQTSPKNVIWMLTGMVMIAFSIWLWKKIKLQQKIPRLALATLLIIICAWPLWVTFHEPISGGATAEQSTSIAQPFSQEKLASLLQEGKPVFVNATAAWCLTCKYNESMYFNTKRFEDFIKENNINYLVADWTNRNDMILHYLQSFKRDGVPLYVTYDRQGKSEVLPQVLTSRILYDSLRKVIEGKIVEGKIVEDKPVEEPSTKKHTQNTQKNT